MKMILREKIKKLNLTLSYMWKLYEDEIYSFQDFLKSLSLNELEDVDFHFGIERIKLESTETECLLKLIENELEIRKNQ